MPTTDWGPAAWKFLHTATFAYGGDDGNASKEEQDAARKLFESLQLMLPCKDCCNHYCNAIKERPLSHKVLKNRENLSRWLVDLHNDVNVRLGKPIFTYEQAQAIYESFTGCSTESGTSCSVHEDQKHVGIDSTRVMIVGILVACVVSILVVAILRARKM
jgi:hypothetical protein